MEVILTEGCDRHCLATDTLVNIGAEVTDLEDNAMENGCDIAGGEIKCEGPKYIAVDEGEICTFRCRAACDIPAVECDSNPIYALGVQAEVNDVIEQAFEIPQS